MQKQKIFRTSHIDFVAYLKTKNINFDNIEKAKNNHRIMFGYEYDFNDLIEMQKDFNENNIIINMQSFQKERRKIIDIVKSM